MGCMKRAVVVVCDSLRRDMMTTETTPNLLAIASRSVVFKDFSPVFPSVTRASSPAIATGCHPVNHGILGSAMVIDEGTGPVCASVGDPDFVDRLRKVRGTVLFRPTISELLQDVGDAKIFSNVSAGAAYLLDPEGYGYVYHRAGSYGPGRKPVPAADRLDIAVGIEGDAEMTRRFCRDVIEGGVVFGTLWLSEPDNAGHNSPLGSPTHIAAIKSADRCVGNVLEAIAVVDPHFTETVLFVCSDHGMNSVRRTIDIAYQLVHSGFKSSYHSDDIVVADSGTSARIHISNSAKDRKQDLINFLNNQDWVDRAFSSDDLHDIGSPSCPGTSIVIAMAGDNVANEYGVSGMSDCAIGPDEVDQQIGVGQHGGAGFGEVQPFLFVRGPNLRASVSEAKVSLVDLAPTILEHLDVKPPRMDGRSLLPIMTRWAV
ncbi:MAG: alkaline phosphatase family protein [Mesorhizobium sp.]|nr:MAG: alkaline phosphatase family protein [Mesorhizobium sp.]TIR95611.1 MAG: alkaline phosphatase family protein [Mesorhizobium sp.]